MNAGDKVAIDRERLALYRASARRAPVARGFARMSPRKLLLVGAPLAAGVAVVGADQVIGLTGFLLGAQLFDLFSERELQIFAWLSAITIAAIAVALGGYLRRRYQALFAARDALGKKPASTALDRAAVRLAEELAPDRHRLQMQVFAIAAIAALLFFGFALSLRAAPDASAWPPSWRAAMQPPRALLLLDENEKIDRLPLTTTCASGSGTPIAPAACRAPDCRLRGFLALKAGEQLALDASRAGEAHLYLHDRDRPFDRGEFGRSAGGGPLAPGRPLALTAPRAGWYALDLTLTGGGAPPSLCVALPPRAVAPGSARH